MPKKTSDKKTPTYQPTDLIDPQAWINHRTFAELKEWLRGAVRHQIYSPVVIPHNVMPVSYLAQLLMQSDREIKASLQTIIPQLIKEWGAYDSRGWLDDLLILCGNLNCNEAEVAVSRIITEKLGSNALDADLRRRALSVLQEIGTDRSLHIFKRYIGDFHYAAVCYRSMYLLNLNYAVSELEDLMRLYHWHDATDGLEDVLKILFKYTLTPAEYTFVLQPFVEQAAPEAFVEVLEVLHSIDVLNETYFMWLSAKPRAELITQIMKRARGEDNKKVSALLASMGVPVEHLIPVSAETLADQPVANAKRKRQKFVPAGAGACFVLNTRDKSTGLPQNLPLTTSSVLGVDKSWEFMREFDPDENTLLSVLERPPILAEL